MWTIKEFKTADAMNRWIDKNKSRYQYEEIFVNNGYALEIRKLKIINV